MVYTSSSCQTESEDQLHGPRLSTPHPEPRPPSSWYSASVYSRSASFDSSRIFSTTPSGVLESSRTMSDPISDASYRATPFSLDNRPAIPMRKQGTILMSLVQLGEMADLAAEAISEAMEMSTLKFYTKKAVRHKQPLTDKLNELGDLMKLTGHIADQRRSEAFEGIVLQRLCPAINSLFGKLKMICVILQTAVDEKGHKRRSKKSRDEILDSLGSIHRGVELFQRAAEGYYDIDLEAETEVAKMLLFLKKCRVVWAYEVEAA